MVTLYSLYQIATKNKIKVINIPLKTSKAKIVKYCDQTCIALDKSQITTETEEQQIIAMCLGHFFSHSLHSIKSTNSIIFNTHDVAKKWVYDHHYI